MSEHLFWKFFLMPPRWCTHRLFWHFERDQIAGILYAGITVAGWSLIYSDRWRRR